MIVVIGAVAGRHRGSDGIDPAGPAALRVAPAFVGRQLRDRDRFRAWLTRMTWRIAIVVPCSWL